MLNLHKLIPIAVLSSESAKIDEKNRWAYEEGEKARSAKAAIDSMFYIDAKLSSSCLAKWLENNKVSFTPNKDTIYILSTDSGASYIAIQLDPVDPIRLVIGDASVFEKGQFIPWVDNTKTRNFSKRK